MRIKCATINSPHRITVKLNCNRYRDKEFVLGYYFSTTINKRHRFCDAVCLWWCSWHGSELARNIMLKACLSACLVYQPKRAISPCMQVRRLAKQGAFAAPYTNERELSPPRKRPIRLVNYSHRRRMYCYYHQRFARLFIHPPLCKIMFSVRLF